MTRVLVAEDSKTQALQVKLLLEAAGYEVCLAKNGLEAVEKIKEFDPLVLLTDLEMPEMDGLELIREIKHQELTLPVILMTGRGSEEIALEALKAGAASYLPKRIMAQALVSTISEIAEIAMTTLDDRALQKRLTNAEFRFDIGNESALAHTLVFYLGKQLMAMQAIDEISNMQITMALTEALTNAINHGNLELDSAMRELENGSEKYHQLADERRSREPYQDRSVKVCATLSTEEAKFVVKDDGPGFDTSEIPDPTDPANMEKSSGRGLMLIYTFMDEVSHNDSGSEITMIKRFTEEEEEESWHENGDAK